MPMHEGYGSKGKMVYTMPKNGTKHKSEHYDSVSLKKRGAKR